MADLKGRTAIVGLGQSRFAKQLPDSELVMACEAIQMALDDAGIDAAEVDGLSSVTLETSSEIEIARNLGLRDLSFFSRVGYGGGGACATVVHAAMAVATGQAEVAVAWRSRRRGRPSDRPWAQAYDPADGWAWARSWGLVRPVDAIAMVARRAMYERGLTREHLANVAITQRRHASRNPVALMGDRPLDRDEYFGARWISEPLCLYDNCIETDGAVALVVVSADRARDLPHRPVVIHAAAQGFAGGDQAMTNFHALDPLAGPSGPTATALWRRSDVGPADVDVAQIYDAFSPMVPLSLEAYGFCAPGEGGAFTEDRNTEWGHGRLPVNTSGGSLSEVYIHGFNHLSEAVRQIRGTSTAQVAGAEVSFVSSAFGVPSSALILTR